MIYKNINDVKINEVFKSAYNWYKKRYNGDFKIRIQLIPVGLIKEFGSSPNFESIKVPLDEHKHIKVIEKWKCPKTTRFKGVGRTSSEKVTLVHENPYDLLSMDDMQLEENHMIEEVYPDCNVEILDPISSNNFVLIQSRNNQGYASGKTSFKSILLVSEHKIVDHDYFIQETLETTENLIDKLNNIIEEKNKTIDIYKEHFKMSAEKQKLLISKVKELMNKLAGRQQITRDNWSQTYGTIGVEERKTYLDQESDNDDDESDYDDGVFDVD